jgi:hypothetical protein
MVITTSVRTVERSLLSRLYGIDQDSSMMWTSGRLSANTV